MASPTKFPTVPKLYLLVEIDRTSKFAFVELHEGHPRDRR
jgi:hypothetical protein